MATFAKIQNGVVVNTQVLQPDDIKDPDFVWIPIDGVQSDDGSWVQIGYTYDGNIFSSGVS